MLIPLAMALALSSALVSVPLPQASEGPSEVFVGIASCSGVASSVASVTFSDGLEPSEATFEFQLEGSRRSGSSVETGAWTWTIEMEPNQRLVRSDDAGSSRSGRRRGLDRSISKSEAVMMVRVLNNDEDPLALVGLSELPIGVPLHWTGQGIRAEFERMAGGGWSRTIEFFGRVIDGANQEVLATAIQEVLAQLPE
jgi:hypothetical protein